MSNRNNTIVAVTIGVGAGISACGLLRMKKNSSTTAGAPVGLRDGKPIVPEDAGFAEYAYKNSFQIELSARKSVLITGAGSYIGESFRNYATEHYPNLTVDTLDMRGDDWREAEFGKYDCIYHVAGIAHADVGNVDQETIDNYYAVNTDMAIEVAQICKKAGVKHFIFMSSAIIYGESAPYSKDKTIGAETLPAPANFYGDSKWQADKAVRSFADKDFNVAVLRPPMIYGKGSKGSYPTLAKFAKMLPSFPDVKNSRSMLFIDNLCEFLCKLILSGKGGIFFPQNGEYTRTAAMVKEIAKVSGKSTFESKLFNPAVRFASVIPGKVGRLVNKAFGNLTYDQSISTYEGLDYQYFSLKESIELTESASTTIKECGRQSMRGKPRMLMLTSVASMIDQFNMPNIELLLEIGYDVDVACNFEVGNTCPDEKIAELKGRLNSLGVKYYQIDFSRKVSQLLEETKAYKQVLKLVRDCEYTFIHCHSPIGGVVGRLVGRNTRTKVIYTAHGFHFYDGAPKKNWLVFYPIEKALSCWTDILITINKEDYKRATKAFYAKKTIYIPGVGIDTQMFRYRNLTVEQIDVFRSSVGVPKGAFWLLSVGELNANKNHEVVIRALGDMKRENGNSPLFYTIAGQGKKGKELQQLIDEQGLQNHVKLLGFRNDIRDILKSADIFVHPSFREGLSVSLMEAMACGLPCVASNIRGNTDLVDQLGGRLFNPADYKNCRNKIEEVITGDLKKMGLHNRETINQFSKETVLDRMQSVYKVI